MKALSLITCLLLAVLVVSPAFADGDAAPVYYSHEEPAIPQPYAGASTIAAPDLLERPERSTVNTIQNGQVNPVTDELIDRNIIPTAEDASRQGGSIGPVVPSN